MKTIILFYGFLLLLISCSEGVGKSEEFKFAADFPDVATYPSLIINGGEVSNPYLRNVVKGEKVKWRLVSYIIIAEDSTPLHCQIIIKKGREIVFIKEGVGELSGTFTY